MDCSLVKSGTFRVLRRTGDSWSCARDVAFIQKRVCACGYRKREKVIS